MSDTPFFNLIWLGMSVAAKEVYNGNNWNLCAVVFDPFVLLPDSPRDDDNDH